MTDVGNGVALCPQRHTCLHSGFYATGDPNGTLAFHRRSGLAIGTSTAGIAGRVPAWLP